MSKASHNSEGIKSNSIETWVGVKSQIDEQMY